MFKHYPFIKQLNEKDCGVCSLAMIIKYYGGNYTLNELRKLTNTNNHGTTAYHLIEASKKIGFTAKGIKCKFDDLNKDNFILPCIAHLKYENSGHYIVIYKVDFKKKIIVIADPANKIKTITFNEFIKNWNEVLIFLYPITKLEIHKNMPIYKIVFSLFKQNKKLLINIIILSLLITLSNIITSFYLKTIVESLKQYYFLQNLILISLFFGTFYVFKNITLYYRNIVIIYLNQKIDLTLIIDVIKHLIHLPYLYYHNHTTGDVIQRISDAMTIKNSFTNILIFITTDLILFLSSLLLIIFINEKLTLILLIYIFIYFCLYLLFKNIIVTTLNNCKQEEAHLNTSLTESLIGINSIKGLHLEANFDNKLENGLINYSLKQKGLGKILNLRSLIYNLLKDINFIIFISFIMYLIVQKELSTNSIFIIQSLLFNIMNSLDSFTNLDIELSNLKLSLQRLIELQEEKIKDGVINKLYLKEINIKNLSYSNDKNVQVLKDITLCIKKGEKIVLVGTSGSGKSTLLKLCSNFYSSKRNKIFFNDFDYLDYSDKAREKNITYLSQDEYLFTGTILNNIIMNRSYDELILKKVIKICKIDLIVKDKSLGLNTLIYESGVNLSGGEKNRIILARYLLKATNYIFIDEGLSQIDTNMERQILKDMFKYFSDKTFVIVSHRLDNLDLFDRMIKLEEGQVILDVSK